MSVSMFIDESKAKGYRLAVTLIANEQVANARARVREQVLSGQRRIHFAKESDRRRKEFLSAIADLGSTTHIYRVGSLSELEARQLCLTAALKDPRARSVSRIVVEIDPSILTHDRRILTAVLRCRVGASDVTFRHERPDAEPLLWIPDAIAWCHARNPEWRRRIQPLIDGVTNLDR